MHREKKRQEKEKGEETMLHMSRVHIKNICLLTFGSTGLRLEWYRINGEQEKGNVK